MLCVRARKYFIIYLLITYFKHPLLSIVNTRRFQMDSRFTDEAIAYCQLVASLLQPSNGLSAEFLRKFFDDVHTKSNEKLIGTFTGSLEERKVTTKSADIPVNIYTPIDAEKDKLVIYFHGGGWTLGSRNTHQSIVNLAADLTKTIWISVEYRLGPEYRYPIWLDDSCDVTRHIIENKELYGVDQAAKIGVAGDSAGAMISTSICQTVKNIDFQVLIYGLYDFTRTAPSYKEFTDPQYVCTPELLDWFITHTFDDGVDMKDPRISVFLNPSPDLLPATLFIVAELDALRDDSFAYKEILDKVGIMNKLSLFKGVPHGFFSLPAIYPKACTQAVDTIKEFMASI
ncbi:unnamed protein product [Rotaria magnacalcarata]|uniref:Alpha/beta hydrolase fold-3 domain-containing protein n=1 Tax=Rotaria magnacalcarata TaxID=392030 RepID=A0A819N4W4_9BILA|nr:unnamed protein product [Rotaria magnacalcarata]CAF3990784.1 unnamed protein product [Rotaria magnacalcarata]